LDKAAVYRAAGLPRPPRWAKTGILILVLFEESGLLAIRPADDTPVTPDGLLLGHDDLTDAAVALLKTFLARRKGQRSTLDGPKGTRASLNETRDLDPVRDGFPEGGMAMANEVPRDRLLLTLPQVAELLQLKPPRIYAMVRDRRLKAVRMGRLLRFRPQDVEALIDRQATAR
jgi:excisionase family DNA binding protein